MNLLKRIQLWFTNDWKIIEVLHGKWTTGGKTFDIASYEILYSPSRNKYKLKLSGFWPKKHTMYSVAIKKLLEYESDKTTKDNS